MEEAPLFAEIARGPEGGRAFFLTAEDGVRLRLGLWTRTDARGTVFLLPGRTEYVEKYGPAAADLARRGYAMVTIDWRGQGLADRALADRAAGHVARFADYQRDMRAMIAAARALRLPLPWHMIGHSMGGAIGLRALAEGFEAHAAVFSAPMWGIVLPAWKRPLAQPYCGVLRALGRGHRYAPGLGAECYVLTAPFEDNFLTSDPAMYDFMRRQLRARPELVINGPSYAWVHEALTEARALRAMNLPEVPALAVLGSAERIVERSAVEGVMARWPGGRLEIYEGARHEVMMEGEAHRRRFFDEAAALFEDAPQRLKTISVYR